MGSAIVLLLVGLAGFGAGYVWRAWRELEPPAGPVESYLDDRREELRSEYADGHISREQFAGEIETVEDPQTERIMHLARDVDGIGPHTAYKVAREFDGVDELLDADRERLESINGVGENRANGLLRRVELEREE